MRTIQEPARSIPVVAEADVVVLGGGPAGIAAAASAARTGARTLLLERYGFLGGMGTAAMVTNFCGLHANINGSVQQVVHGIADEVLGRLARLDGLNPPHPIVSADGKSRTAAQSYDTAAYKIALDDLLLSAGVAIRFHTLAVGAITGGRRIDGIVIETKSGRGAVLGRRFIDCSGDADLALWAGAPVEKGGDDGFLAYPTLMFRLAGVDDARAQAEGRPHLRALIAAANDSGEWRLPRRAGVINSQAHPGEWRANLTQVSRDGGPIDGTDADDLTFAEVEGRRQVQDYFRFLKARVPGFEAAYLLETAPQIGIRETRRIVGRTVVGLDDVLGCRDVPDAIGVNGWPLEKHELGDVRWLFLEGRGYHQVPFGCLVPQGVDNLLAAGRCLSATQDGQASLRVSGPCFVMGQAAGTAAAMSLTAGIPPGDVDIPTLQARLAADGAWLGA